MEGDAGLHRKMYKCKLGSLWLGQTLRMGWWTASRHVLVGLYQCGEQDQGCGSSAITVSCP